MKTYKLLFENSLEMETVFYIKEKIFIADEVYQILKDSYKKVKGGLLFKSPDDLIQKSDIWKVIYSGSSIVGVLIYKFKKGFKMVALGIREDLNSFEQKATKKLLKRAIKMLLPKSWMELSEGAERFILKAGGENFLIPNSLVRELTSKDIIELCEDGYHYKRYINGVLKTKVLVGNPKVLTRESIEKIDEILKVEMRKLTISR